MTVTYDSYEAAVVGNVITMLANSARFQIFCGASGTDLVAAAKSRIVESDGGDDIDNISTENRKKAKFKITTCDGQQFDAAIPLDKAFAKVHLTACQHPSISIGTIIHRGQVMIWYLCPYLKESVDARFRRARNDSGLIRADLEAQQGHEGCLNNFSITALGPELGDDSGPYRQTVGFAHQIDWSAP